MGRGRLRPRVRGEQHRPLILRDFPAFIGAFVVPTILLIYAVALAVCAVLRCPLRAPLARPLRRYYRHPETTRRRAMPDGKHRGDPSDKPWTPPPEPPSPDGKKPDAND